MAKSTKPMIFDIQAFVLYISIFIGLYWVYGKLKCRRQWCPSYLTGDNRLRGWSKSKLKTFNPEQIRIVNNSASIAEELVSNAYKLSVNEWLGRRYDIKTLADLSPDEVVHGPFAQIIRYRGQRTDTSLSSAAYDLYKICFQDHTILNELEKSPQLQLFPFSLYIITHELVHIVRFTKFMQNFVATSEEKMKEEMRVHKKTHDILGHTRIDSLSPVLAFYSQWRTFHGRSKASS